MNELLLILLIVFTLMTFLSLNRKMGNHSAATPVPLPALQPEFIKETKVLYSSTEKEYNRSWSVTSVAGDFVSDAKKEMKVIYHQLCKNNNQFPYLPADSEIEFMQDVCVISSISDLQYHHVLLPADFTI
ncbi:MAG: hypothetical protein KF746_08690 [Chitinophagaceae bacterium]|nr:hypothetical protein [Chitinophagaceae bacterium]